LKDKPFFPGLIKYMASGPVVAMVWQGLDAVKTGRVMLGATNPLASAPGTSLGDLPCVYAKRDPMPRAKSKGTIRGDFALAVGRNICHGSHSVENAEKEIRLSVFSFGCTSCIVPMIYYIFSWFPEGIVQYEATLASWIFE
jgi:nucleoside-diphosphate kinase